MAVPYQRTFGTLKLDIWRAAEGNGIRAGTATSGSAVPPAVTILRPEVSPAAITRPHEPGW